MVFEKIVKKLLKYSGKILATKELQRICSGDISGNSQWYAITRSLTGEGYIIPLRSGIYLIRSPHSPQENLSTFALSKKYYWPILHSLLRSQNMAQEAIIIGSKSLEIHLEDYFLPKKLPILSRSSTIRSTILTGYTFHMAPSSMENPLNRSNFYSLTKKYSYKIQLNEYTFNICCIEQALLEYLQVRSGGMGEIRILLRAIERLDDIFRSDVFLEFCSMKYITSVNRLYHLCEGHTASNIRQACLRAIARYGNG